MKKFVFLCAVILGAVTLNAGPHHHRGNKDLRKAADIINLVGASVNLLTTVTQPQQTVVVHTPPPPPPAPAQVVVVTPPPPPAPVVVVTPPRRPVTVRPVPPPPPRHQAPGHFRGAPPHRGRR